MKGKYAKKFRFFLENLKNEKNSPLMDTIAEGFDLCESLSTDDANAKKLGQSVGTYGPPANAVTTKPNLDNEYFDQTLDEEILEKVMRAQGGGMRTWVHPSSGKGVFKHDPLKSGHGTNPNANFSSEIGWAGDSGGYNLGGPS